MNSVLDQQQELLPSTVVIDEAWYNKRIEEQFDYVNEVLASNRSRDRKRELVVSAIGMAVRLLELNPYNNLANSFSFAFRIVEATKHTARSLAQLVPKHAPGGVLIKQS